jgi:CRISPR/Cas system CMR subunit Cmr4 (Cas7 group RAMP superfamily)
MDDPPTVSTRHLANLAGALLDAVQDEADRLDTFRCMEGRATVVIDDAGADVVLHDRDATVHVRLDSDTD